MKKIYLYGLLLFVHVQACSTSFDQSLTSWGYHYQSFDNAMQLWNYPDALSETSRIIGIDGLELYDFFKKLYEKNNPASLHFEECEVQALKIPKIIHFIWLGSPVPKIFAEYIKSWAEHHMEGWSYKLWTDKDVEKFGLYNQEFYDLSRNYGEKADLVRYEIIYRYGGLYVDVDFECLRSLESLHYTCDFYAGVHPLDTGFVQVGNALFAACPGHPILQHCIETIRNDWHSEFIPQRTGPIHFTKSFYKYAGSDNFIDIAFPALYFYPVGCSGRSLLSDGFSHPYAMHHWAKSWVEEKGRPKKFRNLHGSLKLK